MGIVSLVICLFAGSRDGKPVRHLNGSNAVYLDVEPAVPGRDVDENPRGRVLREVPPIDFVNRREHLD
jgi:hypothetical protein